MAIALTPNQKRDFILSADRSLPAEKQTVFELRGVPVALRSKFNVLIGFAPKTESADPLFGISRDHLNALYLLAIRCCLVGWRNFRDADGNELKFSGQTIDVDGMPIRGAATDESLELLGTSALAELGAECINGMIVTKSDVLS